MNKAIKLTDTLSVPTASRKLTIATGAGLAASLAAGLALSWAVAPLIGWDVAAITFMATTWPRVLKFDAGLVQKHALREDPSRVAADVVLIGASVASLGAVALVLLKAGGDGSAQVIGQAFLGFISVFISWLVVHTVYTLRYAELYYRHPAGGVDFGETKNPVYLDFAYLSFTVGMTYQVSDTGLQTRPFRNTVLRQALLSYLFGAIIIATTINLVAGLGK